MRNAEGKFVAFRKFESQFAANKPARLLRQSPEATAGEITVGQSVMATQEHKERRVKEMGRDRAEPLVRNTPKTLRPANAEALQ